MKLKEYFNKLKELKKQYGDDIELIYSQDDEGNYFDKVVFGAEAVYYDDRIHEIHELDDEHPAPNAICIN